jgi:hypothetical protein
MSSIPPKPWNVAQFEKHRSHMTSWVVTDLCPLLDDSQCRRVVIRAPVKSGKREIAEYMAKRDESHTSPRVHAFMSAWHRAADEDQRKEIAEHNMKVFAITKKTVADDCVKWIMGQIQLGKTVVMHLDECDHGSGDKQILGKVYKKVRNLAQVFTILYSATPQEVLFSKDIGSVDDDEMLDDMLYGTLVEYTPPVGYCGPARFLDEGLVIEAKPFFTMKPVPALTEQGREIIEGLKTSTASGSRRNIVALRLTKKEGRGKNGKEIYQFLQNSHMIPELKDVNIIVDKIKCKWVKSLKIQWSDPSFWRLMAGDQPLLIVMDQTSSRSTEWACHDRMYATHDYRTARQYAILSQAQERVNHYDSKYASGFQPIRVYGHKKTFELSAARISYEQYFACAWSMRKVNARRSRRDNLGEVYEIKNEAGVLHPVHSTPMSKARAEEVLRDLGCFGDLSLSSRVLGKVRTLPVYDSHWFPSTMETWDADIADVKATPVGAAFQLHAFENPFANARARSHAPGPDGKEFGYLRGWKVFDYETQVKTQAGWGVGPDAPRVTVCYKNGVLGAAVRWDTGEFRENNRLNAYRSMYPSKR